MYSYYHLALGVCSSLPQVAGVVEMLNFVEINVGIIQVEKIEDTYIGLGPRPHQLLLLILSDCLLRVCGYYLLHNSHSKQMRIHASHRMYFSSRPNFLISRRAPLKLPQLC